MQANKQAGRIHPLMGEAAASVMLVSLVGTAAITGILPTSHGTNAPSTAAVSTSSAPVEAGAIQVIPQSLTATTYTEPQHAVHRHHVAHPTAVAQTQSVQYVPQAPVSQQSVSVAHNSPLGIGVGAVIGGLLGSQVGGGHGRTLATIAGAVGGGYIGNEIANKSNQ